VYEEHNDKTVVICKYRIHFPFIVQSTAFSTSCHSGPASNCYMTK